MSQPPTDSFASQPSRRQVLKSAAISAAACVVPHLALASAVAQGGNPSAGSSEM